VWVTRTNYQATRMGTRKGLCFAVVIFFIFNGLLGDQLSQNVLYRSSPNFQHRLTYGWIRWALGTFFSRLLNGRWYGNGFFARIGENWHTHLHSVRCHSTMNRRNTKEMHGLTVCIIRLRLTKIKWFLVGTITIEFCRHICPARATRSTSPRIIV